MLKSSTFVYVFFNYLIWYFVPLPKLNTAKISNKVEYWYITISYVWSLYFALECNFSEGKSAWTCTFFTNSLIGKQEIGLIVEDIMFYLCSSHTRLTYWKLICKSYLPDVVRFWNSFLFEYDQVLILRLFTIYRTFSLKIITRISPQEYVSRHCIQSIDFW